jgi:hypothetical protein
MQECFGDWAPEDAMEFIYLCLGVGYVLNVDTKRGLWENTRELCQKVAASAAKAKKGASKANGSSKGVTKSKAAPKSRGTAKGAAAKVVSAVEEDEEECDDAAIPASRCIGR